MDDDGEGDSDGDSDGYGGGDGNGTREGIAFVMTNDAYFPAFSDRLDDEPPPEPPLALALVFFTAVVSRASFRRHSKAS